MIVQSIESDLLRRIFLFGITNKTEPGWRRERLNASAAGEKVEDKNDDRKNEKNVNQPATNVETETKKPENEKHDDDCPKHFVFSPEQSGTLEHAGRRFAGISRAFVMDKVPGRMTRLSLML